MKIIIWKKKAAALLAAALAVSLGGYAVSYPAEAHAAERQLPIYCVDRGQQKVCSISFDAAWGDVRLRSFWRQNFSLLKHISMRSEHAEATVRGQSPLRFQNVFSKQRTVLWFFSRLGGQRIRHSLQVPPPRQTVGTEFCAHSGCSIC